MDIDSLERQRAAAVTAYTRLKRSKNFTEDEVQEALTQVEAVNKLLSDALQAKKADNKKNKKENRRVAYKRKVAEDTAADDAEDEEVAAGHQSRHRK